MSTIMNFILEGNLKQTVLYTYSTIMNFILEGKLCFTETKRLCRITLLGVSRKEIWSCCIMTSKVPKGFYDFYTERIEENNEM